MPPQKLPREVAAELKELAPGAVVQFTIRINSMLTQKLTDAAAESGNQMSREITSTLANWFAMKENGIMLSIDGTLKRRLDVCADHMGIAREDVVKLLIGEGLPRMLQRAIDLAAETKEREDELHRTSGKKR